LQYLGITGGPGTGKKTIAPQVAKLLGIRSYNLNELAAAFEVIDANHEVDTEKLGRSLSSEVQAPALLFGHLLPYVVSRNQIAKIAVLRCDPKMLKSRLAKRRYDHRKLAENVEAGGDFCRLCRKVREGSGG
jgi:adenylate kinase